MSRSNYHFSYMASPGWYILQNRAISVRRLDGQYVIIRPYNIVQRVKWLDNEGVLPRLIRIITGKVLIRLPSPGTRFAIISKKQFAANFKRVQEPRSRWPHSQC